MGLADPSEIDTRRGLLLVAQIAERSGTRQTPTGKTIWVEQALPTGTPQP